jgi:hypothetical protein
MKECPLQSGNKAKEGWIWGDLSKFSKPLADDYLKNHKDYVGPRIAATSVPSTITQLMNNVTLAN